MQKETGRKRTFNCRSCGGKITMYANDSMVKCTHCGNICEVSGGGRVIRKGSGKPFIILVSFILLVGGLAAGLMLFRSDTPDAQEEEAVVMYDSSTVETYADGPIDQDTSMTASEEISRDEIATEENSQQQAPVTEKQQTPVIEKVNTGGSSRPGGSAGGR